jgi:thymidylate kinase
MLITFSGLDGSGKSTLIAHIQGQLEMRGHRVQVMTMYDHLSFYAKIRALRESIIHRGDRCAAVAQLTVPVTESFQINPNDPKTDVSDKKGFLRRIFYRIIRGQSARRAALFLDLLVLWAYRFLEEFRRGSIFITDRYLYDSLADVADLESKKWSFIRFFLKFVPVPDLPVLVDVPAEMAFARKPEYPLAYSQWRREAYRTIYGWVPRGLVLDNTDLRQAQLRLERAVSERLAQ